MLAFTMTILGRTTRWHQPRYVAIGLLIVVLSAPGLSAQTEGISAPPANTDPVVRVSVDLAAGAFDRALPFDVPFFIAGRAPAGAQRLEVQYAQPGDTPNPAWIPDVPIVWKSDGTATPDGTFLVLVRTPLDAGRRYLFRFSFAGDRPSESVTSVEGNTSQKNYVSADVGVLYAGDIDTGAVYIGTNIYFRPVNKDAPLSVASGLGRRLALTVGVTLSPVADENDRTRSDLFWNQSLVIGAGYRLTSSIRAGVGALVFMESNPNPLITERNVATTWYVSLSFDVDVGRIFR